MSECDSAHLSIVESRGSVVGTAIRVRVWGGIRPRWYLGPFGREVGQGSAQMGFVGSF